MQGNEKLERFLERYPHRHRLFFERPHVTRRQFFTLAGAGVTGSFLARRAAAGEVVHQVPVTMQNKAHNVIFILLAGAASHVDTFDFKMVEGATPSSFNPAKVSGLDWPTGLLPKLAQNLPDMAIVRSMRSWALQHGLAQVWAQIGRSPAGALGDIAPNIGSVVAIEKERERQSSQVFPTFLALNSGGAIGSGYLSAAYAPMKINPATSGLPDTINVDGAARFESKWSLLNALDAPLRVNSPIGADTEDYDGFYKSAKGLMYNPVVDQAFRYTTAESQRYGNTGFGNACVVAQKVLAANQGTRFVQITIGGWDHHQNIYDANGLPRLARQLDDGLSTMLTDLKANGLLNETLVVMMGEFGRTVGRLSAQNGRDHFLQQFVVFAGGGVRGGRAIGSTNATGAATAEFGWSRDRDVRPEDVEATIYSALGINWTTVRYDDPFGRGFEYVPYANQDVYGPINELWA